MISWSINKNIETSYTYVFLASTLRISFTCFLIKVSKIRIKKKKKSSHKG